MDYKLTLPLCLVFHEVVPSLSSTLSLVDIHTVTLPSVSEYSTITLRSCISYSDESDIYFESRVGYFFCFQFFVDCIVLRLPCLHLLLDLFKSSTCLR